MNVRNWCIVSGYFTELCFRVHFVWSALCALFNIALYCISAFYSVRGTQDSGIQLNYFVVVKKILKFS